MNILGFFQRLGRALQLPIAVLPVAALLLRFGQPDLLNVAFIAQAGGAIFDNLALIFAIGVASSWSKDSAGAAALAGAVGYFVLTKAMVTINPEINMGVLAGIITGLVGGAAYNRWSDIKLPDFLSFFGGKRFVPIATGFFCLVLAAIFGYVWPPVQHAIHAGGEWIVSAGALGSGIFGFINRLLIPTGLHQVLNTIAWFQIGEFTNAAGTVFHGDINRFYAGDGTAGMFMSGFFPIMMFGLPAGALAIYKNAKPENKKATGSLMLAGALAAFLTGVTEPLEFSFMFAAFPLYVVHALLTAISVFIAASFQWIAGFNFSAGFIDWFLSLKVPAAHMPWMLIVQGLVFAVIYYFVFDFMIKKFNMKTPGRGDDDNDDASSAAFDTATSSTGDKYADLAGKLYAALGGHDNITEIENCITRLRMGVVDSSKVDVDAIRKTGVPGVKVIDKKNVQIIVGTQVQAVADARSALYGKPVIGGGSPKA
mgnify:CR=1 FL=1